MGRDFGVFICWGVMTGFEVVFGVNGDGGCVGVVASSASSFPMLSDSRFTDDGAGVLGWLECRFNDCDLEIVKGN